MSSLTVGFLSFAFIFGGMMLGMALRALLPEHHLSDESRDSVKLGIGMIATLAALVLGLLTASAKGTFDTMTAELRQTGAKILLLDRVMAQYGPEAREARGSLRRALVSAINRIWPEERNTIALEQVRQSGNNIQVIQDNLLHLSPQNNAQRWLQSRALQLISDIAEARSLISEQVGQGSLPLPFLVMLVFWLTIIFASFGLFAPRNITVIVVLFVCALSAAASLFMIVELDFPYQGIIKISSAPLHIALANLGR